MILPEGFKFVPEDFHHIDQNNVKSFWHPVAERAQQVMEKAAEINRPQSMEDAVKAIVTNREQIREQFIRAFLATNVPDEKLNPAWLSENLELVERKDGEKLLFYVRLREQK